MSQKLNESILVESEILENDPAKLPAGILSRVRRVICEINKKNANNRKYRKDVWEKVLNDEGFKTRLANRQILGEMEHPENVQLKLDKDRTSHIVSNVFIDEKAGLVKADFDILPTEAGKFIHILHEAGVKVPASTRAEGELKEAVDEDGSKYSDVVPESYRFVTIDHTGDPSCSNTEPEAILKAVKTHYEGRSIDKNVALALLENLTSDEAKKLKESILIDEQHEGCGCAVDEKKCKGCKKSKGEAGHKADGKKLEKEIQTKFARGVAVGEATETDVASWVAVLVDLDGNSITRLSMGEKNESEAWPKLVAKAKAEGKEVPRSAKMVWRSVTREGVELDSVEDPSQIALRLKGQNKDKEIVTERIVSGWVVSQGDVKVFVKEAATAEPDDDIDPIEAQKALARELGLPEDATDAEIMAKIPKIPEGEKAEFDKIAHNVMKAQGYDVQKPDSAEDIKFEDLLWKEDKESIKAYANSPRMEVWRAKLSPRRQEILQTVAKRKELGEARITEIGCPKCSKQMDIKRDPKAVCSDCEKMMTDAGAPKEAVKAATETVVKEGMSPSDLDKIMKFTFVKGYIESMLRSWDQDITRENALANIKNKLESVLAAMNDGDVPEVVGESKKANKLKEQIDTATLQATLEIAAEEYAKVSEEGSKLTTEKERILENYVKDVAKLRMVVKETEAKLEEARQAALLVESSLKEQVDALKASAGKESKALTESANREVKSIVEAHRKDLLNKYIECRLKFSGLTLSESAQALLEQAKSEEGVEQFIGEYRKALREGLHFRSTGDIVLTETKPVDAKRAEIDKRIGMAFGAK